MRETTPLSRQLCRAGPGFCVKDFCVKRRWDFRKTTIPVWRRNTRRRNTQQGLRLEGNTELWAGLGYAYAVSGQAGEAHKVLDELKDISTHRYVAPYNVAVVYAGLGNKDAAFAWLDRAYADRSYLLAVYLNTDERLDSLRSDNRFQEIRRRMKLP